MHNEVYSRSVVGQLPKHKLPKCELKMYWCLVTDSFLYLLSFIMDQTVDLKR